MSMIRELFNSLFKKRATVLYPQERDRVHLPEGFRGKLEFYEDKCIGCSLCFQVCPSLAIEMVPEDKSRFPQNKVGRRPIFNIARCTYCAQCEDICPTQAIHLTNQYEVIALDKRDLVVK